MARLVKSAYVSYVYLIGYDDKIKIGKANSPRVRLSQLQVGIPDKIELIGTIGCHSEKEAYRLEERLHELYSDKNIRAEWYSLTKLDCSDILCEYVDRLEVEIPQGELYSMLKDLNYAEFKVLMYYRTRPFGWVFSDADIVKYTESTERVVKKSMKALKAKGYLK